MHRAAIPLLMAAALAMAQEEVIFRSEVSLVRVDAQVLDRSNRAITGLSREDFVLREAGQIQEIRNFASEEMPVDFLLLLDVSGSMRPHVERVASASYDALKALGEGDRVAIMAFDRTSRMHLPFRYSHAEIQAGLEKLLRDEMFNGGTDITRALLDAAEYVRANARRDARRAIVILTDDQTERNRDEQAAGRALVRADAVLSLLLAPDAMGFNRTPPLGGSWPGGVGGGPWGGIILGRRRPPVTIGRTRSAGTAEIARRSGGDSMDVDDAEALETTISRLRQRYALHFYLPPDAKPGEERQIEVTLSAAAQRRYPGATVRYRQVYLAPGAGEPFSTPPESVVISQAPEPDAQSDQPAPLRRRRVTESGPRDGPLDVASDEGWKPAPQSAPHSTEPQQPQQPEQEGGGWRRVDEQPDGWRRVRPGEKP